MYRRLILIFTVSSLVWLTAFGCSNPKIDTAKVRQVFQSVAGPPKDWLEQGLTAIDQSNYVAAVHPLKKIAFSAKLDKDQKAILEDTIAKVQVLASKQHK